MFANIKAVARKCYAQLSPSDVNNPQEPSPSDRSRASAADQAHKAHKALVTALTIDALERATHETTTGVRASRAPETEPAPPLHASLTQLSNSFRLATHPQHAYATYANCVGLLSLDSLTRLPAIVASDATVFFDLDQTLVERKHEGGVRQLHLTQPDAPQVVQRLQHRDDVCVLGLTARPYYRRGRDNALKTENELRDLGIDFLTQKTADFMPRVSRKRNEVGFRNGCGYTGSTITKGELLMRLHEQVPMAKIIFVDDVVQNLHTVAEFAVFVGIPCLAVHYTGALDKTQGAQQHAAWEALCADWCSVGASLVVAKHGASKQADTTYLQLVAGDTTEQ